MFVYGHGKIRETDPKLINTNNHGGYSLVFWWETMGNAEKTGKSFTFNFPSNN